MRGIRVLSTAFVLGGALLMGGGVAAAQEATRGGRSLAQPRPVHPDARTLEEIQAIAGTTGARRAGEAPRPR